VFGRISFKIKNQSKGKHRTFLITYGVVNNSNCDIWVVECSGDGLCVVSPAGVFALLIGMAVLKYLQSILSKAEFKYFFIMAALLTPVLIFLTVVGLTYAGVIAPWSGRYSVRLQLDINAVNKLWRYSMCDDIPGSTLCGTQDMLRSTSQSLRQCRSISLQLGSPSSLTFTF
jgi:hypothetical protein